MAQVKKQIENGEDLTEVFLESVRGIDTDVIVNRKLTNDMVNALRNWLTKEEQYNNLLQEDAKRLERISSFQTIISTQKKIDVIVQSYEEFRKADKTDTLVEHYLQGYELLHRIREIVTKQEINYKILYTDGGDLYEGNISLSQLLEDKGNFSWAINSTRAKYNENMDMSRLISVRLKNSQAKKIVETALAARAAEEEKEKQLIAKVRYPKFWNSLIEVRDRAGLDIYTYNLGRLYEVYTQCVNEKPEFKDYALRMNSTKAIVQRILNTKGENVKGWQQGDYGLTQLKAVYNSNAGIISSASLKRQFKALIEALNEGVDKKTMEEKLIKIFTAPANKIHTRMAQKIRIEAIENIKNFVDNS